MTELQNYVGHFAYSLVFLGMFMVARKQVSGWVFRLLGELLWVVIGFQMGASSIWGWGLAFIAVDVIGYWSWLWGAGSEEDEYEG